MTDSKGSFSEFLWAERQRLAANIRRLRAERDLTQAGLAEITLLHANTVNRLENPELDSVTLSTMARVAWALGVPVTALLGEENDCSVSQGAAGGGGANHPGLHPFRPDR